MKPNSLGYNILMLALPRWDGRYSSTSYSLAKELSRYNNVYYFDNPFTIKDIIIGFRSNQVKRRLKALFFGYRIFTNPDPDYPNLTIVTPITVIPINWMSPGMFYRFLLKVNDLLLKKSVKKTLKSTNSVEFVFINSFNPFYGIDSFLSYKPKLFVYQTVDDISQSSYISKHGTYLETEMILRADLTFVTSTELRKLKLKYTDKVYLLPNAANIELFNRAVTDHLSRPKELINLSEDKKVVCYIGNICQRLDYDLLKKIAEINTKLVLLMIGPFANDFYKRAGLDKLPNVIFTGSKSLSELPAYLQYSHCCIIPFIVNQLTKSIYPLKINEYLAAGKPVVTTDFSEDIRQFKGVAHVSRNHDEFIANILISINEQSQEQIAGRLAVASRNDWHSRSMEMINVMKNAVTSYGT